jgi:hypothetical protein
MFINNMAMPGFNPVFYFVQADNKRYAQQDIGNEQMLIVTPVFNLQGNCEEAIRLYEKAFETKADFILHYAESDFVGD